jgi:hypothetical protein
MKTVISASRRTDIPAFYLSWFMDAINAGKLEVVNPVYRQSCSIVDLSPEKVGWIVFWSRNYYKFLNNHSFFSDYQLFFHFTIISHHPVLEKKHLIQYKAIEQMGALVKIYGPEYIIWRYDPIVLWQESDRISTNFDTANFRFLCEQFATMGIDKCYFSFAHPYMKFKRRFKMKYPEFDLITDFENNRKQILKDMESISSQNKITLYSCCNDDLIDGKIKKGKCISGSLLNKLNSEFRSSEARHAIREDCGCSRSIDVGDYIQQPCHYGCIYCYANPLWK